MEILHAILIKPDFYILTQVLHVFEIFILLRIREFFCVSEPAPRIFSAYASFSAFAHLLHVYSAHSPHVLLRFLNYSTCFVHV